MSAASLSSFPLVSRISSIVTRGVRQGLGLAGAFALVACVADAPEKELPAHEAERARELTFLQTPRSRTVSREQYLADETARGRKLPEDYLAYMHESYGRLGFFSAKEDLREVSGGQASFFTAYYSAKDKMITLIGESPQDTVVHELVHALQDQHFDLLSLYERNPSSDETMALRGLIEGDAVMAENRYVMSGRREEPAKTLAREMTPETARSESESVLCDLPGPAIFKAYPAFAYSYGPVYVANLLEIRSGSWKAGMVDAMFRAGGPKTTREIMDGGEAKGLAAAPVGLARLPTELSATHEAETVDRLGAWYSYLLFNPECRLNVLPPSRADRDDRDDGDSFTLARAWRGDQLVVLRERDASVPPGRQGTRAVMWSSDWGSADNAEEARARLSRLHGAVHEPAMGDHVYRARDAELVWLGAVEGTLVFIKNLPPEAMEILARAVFETHEQERMPIVKRYARDPLVGAH